jgi:hypothetical protein
MGLKKQYLKKTGVCKVTFSCPKEAVGSAANVSLVGDFNEWNKETIPMKRLKNGTFTATVTLEPNKEYHFRYFVDGQRWKMTGTRTTTCPIVTAATTPSSCFSGRNTVESITGKKASQDRIQLGCECGKARTDLARFSRPMLGAVHGDVIRFRELGL